MSDAQLEDLLTRLRSLPSPESTQNLLAVREKRRKCRRD